MRLDRRTFLTAVARAGVSSVALSMLPPWLRDARGQEGAAAASDLIVRNDAPEHWETSLAALGRAWLTPNELFFVRSHFTAPTLRESGHRIEVRGLVRTPLTLAVEELSRYPALSRAHTLECAGNGRGLYRLPSTSGTQWEYGAVGTAAWGGVALRALLEQAGLPPEAKHVWFEAADRAPFPQVPRFVRSIPLDKAMDDVLLATAMNGEPLPRLHGGPIRAIVPGWYGMASTKWITRIRVEAQPSDNHFMVRGYRYQEPGVTDPKPVEWMRVKSLITSPLEGERLAAGAVTVRGFAWTGRGTIARVETSTDGGKTWEPARLTGESAPLAWRSWEAQVPLAAGGAVTVQARATDAAGETQPAQARPNAAGYAHNSIHRVTFRARA